jgi:arylsulfatase A-like enzyme
MANPAPPDILFILIDDMGWVDLGCYDSTFYETPNIDRLAEQGLRFTDAYASCPVCSPTRASFLTGKYPATVGITNYIAGNGWGKLMGVPYFKKLPQHETTIADALRAGGYKTYHVGKWHLGGEARWPERCGFDVNLAGCDWGHPKHGYFSPYKCPTLEDGPEGEYLTDRLSDEAVKLIEQTPQDQPFFMYLAHYAVHTPINAPKPLIEKYRKKAADLGLDQQQAIIEGEPFPCLHKADKHVQRRVIQSDPAYAAMVENLDTNVGKVLDALDRTGRAENTIVVFTSDNGGLSTAEGSPTCNHPLAEGKGWMYEGGTREPMIIRWPKVVAPGTVTDEPTTTPDFYPTFLEAAGLPPDTQQNIDGVSILPLLRGEPFDRGAIFWHYPHYSNQGGAPGCSVRDGDYKLIEFFEDGRLELYNLREDIGEERNLADEQPDRTKQLHEKLVAWRASVEAKIPQPNPDYREMLADPQQRPNADGVFAS